MDTRDATSARGRRGTYAAGEAARDRILTAARDAFSANGYRGTSLADVGRSVGLTQQGVLYHFPSKSSLLIAVLDARDESDMRNWPPGERLVGLGVLDSWDETVAKNSLDYGLVRLAHVLGAEALSEEHPARSYFREHFEIGRDMLLAGFEAGVERGELRPDLDYAVIARQVIAMSEGLETQWLSDPEAVDLVACFRDFTAELRKRISVSRAR